MKIINQKKFINGNLRLQPRIQKKVDAVVKKFHENPFHPSLKNHPLKGKQNDKRSISVTGDMRIIFREYNNYVIVLMLDVGTHNQVY